MIAQTIAMKNLIEYTGFTRKQLMHFISTGILPYINVGLGHDVPRYRFRISEVDRFLVRIEKKINLF